MYHKIKQLKQNQKILSRLHSPSSMEVYTPLKLVNEMLDTLPEHVWSDPNLTWCDPCCKSGIFLSEIIIRLFDGLKEWESDDDKRYNHIVKNMVFGYFWNHFSKIVCNSYLDSHNLSVISDISDISGYDIFITNPFFNDVSGKSISAGGKKLWERIMGHCVNKLYTNGYICMSHSKNWRSYNSRVKMNIMNSYDVLQIHMDVDGNEGKSLDFSLIRKSNKFVLTMIINRKKRNRLKIKLSEYSVIPNNLNYLDTINNFLSFDDTMKFKNSQTHHSVSKKNILSDENTAKFKYPIKHTGSSPLLWSNKQHESQTEKKVIISYTGYLNPFYDNGVYGVSQHSHYMNVKSKREAEFIIKLLNSKLYNFVLSECKMNGFNDIKLINNFPIPSELFGVNFDDDAIFNYFNIDI